MSNNRCYRGCINEECCNEGRFCFVPDGQGYHTSEMADYCAAHDIWDTYGTMWTDVICDQSCDLVRLIKVKPELFVKE